MLKHCLVLLHFLLFLFKEGRSLSLVAFNPFKIVRMLGLLDTESGEIEEIPKLPLVKNLLVFKN